MFTHPLILIALTAIAIPIAVHLFNFRRYRKVYFSNVEYLKELQQQTRKQSELMRWLILAARILAIVCIVTAFAQPVIPSSGKHLKPGGTAVSIYLDNSFSMNNTNTDGTLSDMGRAKVKEIVAAYEMGDQFQLMTNNADGSQFRWLSKDELIEELEKIEASPNSMPLSAVGERLYDFIGKSNAQNRHCYLIGDFQKSTSDLYNWKSDTTIQTTFVVLKSNKLDNLYIDSIELNAPVYYQGNSLEAKVRINNAGSEPLEQVQVRLFSDDRQRAIANVDIPANGHADAILKMAVDKPGTMQCRVEVTDYPVTFDDKMFFTINVNKRISVHLIGEPNEYLDKLFQGDSSVSYTRESERDINYESLTRNNMIVLNELSTIPSGLAQTLNTWVEEGGTLVVIPGERPDHSYSAALTLWRAPLTSSWSTSRVNVTDIDFESRLFRNVFSGKTDEIELPTVLGHHTLTSGPNTIRSTVMKLADGGDFLTETSNGSGQVYLVATPLRETTTNWVRQALFVPTLYNMALYSRPMGAPYHVIGQEEVIRLTNRYELPHIKSAAIDILPGVRQLSGSTNITLSNQITEAGCYSVEEGETREGIAFNYSRKESDMTPLTQDEVEAIIRDYDLRECSVVPNAQKSMENYIRQQRDDKPLWRWFVVGSLLFILAEIVLLRINRKRKTDAES